MSAGSSATAPFKYDLSTASTDAAGTTELSLLFGMSAVAFARAWEQGVGSVTVGGGVAYEVVLLLLLIGPADELAGTEELLLQKL